MYAGIHTYSHGEIEKDMKIVKKDRLILLDVPSRLFSCLLHAIPQQPPSLSRLAICMSILSGITM